MTDEEVQNIKQATIDELAEQRQLRSCLRAKADIYLREVVGAEEILRRLASEEPLEGNSPTASNWPSHDDLMQLYQEFRDTQMRINLMQKRLREWNVID